MHATDLVGINGITRVLLVYSCQQGVYPRGHVLPVRLPSPYYGEKHKVLWAEHTEHIGIWETSTKFWMKMLNERDHLQDLVVEDNIKIDIKEMG
jgi:hypothetical protein